MPPQFALIRNRHLVIRYFEVNEFTLFFSEAESSEMLSLLRALGQYRHYFFIAGCRTCLEHSPTGHMTHRGSSYIAGSRTHRVKQEVAGTCCSSGCEASSLLGQHLQLPNNSIRLLLRRSGNPSFNTPIRYFAMEVILMEYTIAGFMPVILASVTGTLVLQISLGSASMFSVPSVGLSQWQEIPFVIVAELLLGSLCHIGSWWSV